MTNMKKDIDIHNDLKKSFFKLIDNGRYDEANGVFELHNHLKAIVEVGVFDRKDSAEIFIHFYNHLVE